MVDKDTLISVIILSYKNTQGIYITLDSVLKQTWPSIEIIISDDGTPGFAEEEPKIRAYIDAHAGKNIKNVIINCIERNCGTVKNLNCALKLSNGEYIKALAAEDSLAVEDALEKYLLFLRASGKQICFAKMRGVREDGTYKYELTSCESNYDLLKGLSVEQTRNRLFARNFLPAPAWFATKSLFLDYGYFPEDVRLIEDYPYWCHLTAQGVPFGYLDEVLINYKLSGVSSAGNYSEAFMDDMMIIYDKFIFPYDRRFSVLQPAYNFVKKAGLNFYMTKARWGKLSRGQRLAAYFKYGVFYIYTWLQEVENNYKNKKVAE